jgi:hypothetical protein
MPRKAVPKDDPDELEESWALITPVPEKSYVGRRNRADQCTVKVVQGQTTRNLPMARKIRNHSQGFEWGYAGSGPAQLALAILVDCLGDVERAQALYEKFKFRVIGGLPKQGWELTESVVKKTVEILEEEDTRDTGTHP